MPPEEVFRRAGLLPELDESETMQRLMEVANMLSAEDRQVLLRIARGMVEVPE